MKRWFIPFATLAAAIAAVPASSGAAGGESEAATRRAQSIAFRLAAGGRALCAQQQPATGIAVQVLDQFMPRDRVAMIAAYRLDRGPRVIAVAPGSPAAAAGLLPDDVIAAIDGRPFPAMTDPSAAFDQKAALAATDRIEDRIASATTTRRATLTVLRGGNDVTLSLGSVAACPLRLHVARSSQRNAFADGTHVLLPTGLIDWIRDDDQLALVIAHEMAHNILGHAAEQRRLPRGGDRRALLRRQEDDADVLGAKLARDAGFDLLAGSRLFQLIGNGIELFPTHRGAKARIAMTLAQARAGGEETPKR